MQRREFIAAVGGAAVPVGWPLAAQAQQSVIPIVGYLFGGPRAASFDGAFRKGLSEMGFIEGRNVAIESRYSEDRLPELAAELVCRRVAVIYAGGATGAALAAKAVTTTIPIIFAIGNDPVEPVSSPASTGRAATSQASP
jgi:putative ABC transport system substrate-binding protein